ncbi:hypothetical protein [Aeromicrobium sp. Leaf350]|uniref:hypothetical protein n=1 Tax=Aeromicrobium sp. Leaf350 TaxID=2876565 RepID=UPI001E354499|nr:hypothetical protein [Aeromicrobium sp. Leaf350]
MLAAIVVPTVLLGAASAVSSAAADVPPVPATQFAATCDGETNLDPAAAAGPVSDLTSVGAGRLDKYNAGLTVVLYDYEGAGEFPFVPMCTVRYDAVTGGPVTEWMFCTDYLSEACARSDVDGNLSHYGTPVGQLETLEGNPRLSESQTRQISYLIQNGYSYNVTDLESPFHWGGTQVARADGTSSERAALQTLVWCVSEAEYIANGTIDDDLTAACAETLDDTAQLDLLAKAPAAPELTVSGPAAPLATGATAEVAVETNIFNQPIAVQVDGDPIIEICPGVEGAELVDGQLTILGEPDQTRTVTLCVTNDDVAVVSVDLEVNVASPLALHWNQSPHTIQGRECQHYATFRASDAVVLSGGTTVTFANATAGPPVTPGDDGGMNSGSGSANDSSVVSAVDHLPATGLSSWATTAAVLALALLATGLALVAIDWRKRVPAASVTGAHRADQ